MPLWEYSRPNERYDSWLDLRLEKGGDETWLANQTLYAATTFCALLGTELLRLETQPDLDVKSRLRLAQVLGFDVARQSKTAIRDAFNTLAAQADGQSDEPNKAFGQLYRDLGDIHLDKDDFAPFRQIMRDCIVDIWPVAAGKTVLGIVQPERQLHSILTAAREVNIGPSLREQFLGHTGAITANDGRPPSRKTFDAKTFTYLLAEIPTLVGPTEMQRVMGATRRQLVSLSEDGVLLPRIDIPRIKAPWFASDGIALVAELQEMSIPIEPSDILWEGIQQAKSRSGLRVGAIIASLHEGKLQFGCRRGLDGYAAFGRSVGMRAQGWFESLAAAGHTPHPKWGRERVYVSPRDIADFNKHFLTSATMETEFGQHRKTLLAKLKAAGVNSFEANGETFGALFRREDVETVFS